MDIITAERVSEASLDRPQTSRSINCRIFSAVPRLADQSSTQLTNVSAWGQVGTKYIPTDIINGHDSSYQSSHSYCNDQCSYQWPQTLPNNTYLCNICKYMSKLLLFFYMAYILRTLSNLCNTWLIWKTPTQTLLFYYITNYFVSSDTKISIFRHKDKLYVCAQK